MSRFHNALCLGDYNECVLSLESVEDMYVISLMNK